MAEELYDLVFRGELVPGSDLSLVKKNLQQLFRISEAQVEVLFSGKEVPLKRGLDAETANKYRVAMKKAGAKVNVLLGQAETGQGATRTAASPGKAGVAPAKAAPGGAASSSSVTTTASSADEAQRDLHTDLGAQPDKPRQPRQVINAPDFKVAAVGSDMLDEADRAPVTVTEVDISHLQVTEASGNLVGADEIERLPVLEIDVPDFDLAQAGSDVLRPEERRKVEPANVDVSGMSLAQAGSRLGPEKPEPPAAPNTDHIKLSD